jgi:16S rRNA (guanine527-N7)-methyltransferase
MGLTLEANLRPLLDRGLAELGSAAALPAAAPAQLLRYLALLHKWNRAYNLTAVREPEAMVTRHLLDSLAVLPHLRGEHFIDVGTGAGLPGIPLAIARPGLRFDLLDSNGKKMRFVTQAIAELGLTNARALQHRVEDWRPQLGYDGVLARAFSSLAEMAECCGHLLAADGRLLALKGILPTAEMAALPSGYRVAGWHRLQVPGESGERHLVEIRRDA